MADSIETRVLEALDEELGAESFNLGAGVTIPQARAALQRLRRKGLAEAWQCPDGAWVWIRLGSVDPSMEE